MFPNQFPNIRNPITQKLLMAPPYFQQVIENQLGVSLQFDIIISTVEAMGSYYLWSSKASQAFSLIISVSNIIFTTDQQVFTRLSISNLYPNGTNCIPISPIKCH